MKRCKRKITAKKIRKLRHRKMLMSWIRLDRQFKKTTISILGLSTALFGRSTTCLVDKIPITTS